MDKILDRVDKSRKNIGKAGKPIDKNLYNVGELVENVNELQTQYNENKSSMQMELGSPIELSDEQYLFVASQLLDLAPEEREAEKIKLSMALAYSRRFPEFDVPTAYNNLNAISQSYLGYDFKPTPSWHKAIRQSWEAGELANDRALLANDYMNADLAGDTAKVAEIDAQLREMDKQIYDLRDFTPKNLLHQMVTSAANQIPYMMDVYQAGILGATATGIGVDLVAKAAGIGGSIGAVAGPGGMTLGSIAGGAVAGAIALSSVLFKGQRTAELTQGNTYYNLVNQGVDKGVARRAAGLSGHLSAAIEAIGGADYKEGLKVLGVKLPGTISDFTAKIQARMLMSGTIGNLARWATNMVFDATSEGFEEYVESWKDAAIEAVAKELSGIDPTFDIKAVNASGMEDFFAAFGASLLLGAVPITVNTVNDAKSVKMMMDDAVRTPSKEAFKNRHQNAPEGVTQNVWNNAVDKIYDQYATQRQQYQDAQNLMSHHTVSISEDVDYYTEEEGFVDTDGKELEYTEPIREPNGSIHMELSKKYRVHTSKGDQYKAVATSPDGKTVYGEFVFFNDGKSNNVDLIEVNLNPAYDIPGFKQELVEQFNDNYMQMANLNWKTRDAVEQSIMEDIGSFKKNASDFNAFERQRAMERMSDVFSPAKKFSDPRGAALFTGMAVNFGEMAAAHKGMTINEWLDKEFEPSVHEVVDEKTGEKRRYSTLFGDSESFEADYPGMGDLKGSHKGAMRQVGNSIRAVVYAGQLADPTTFVHESTHLLMLDPHNRTEFQKAFEAVKDTEKFRDLVAQEGIIQHKNIDEMFKDGFGENEDELAAELMELYVHNGKTFQPALQKFFNELTQWFKQIYKHVRHGGEMNEELIRFYDGLLGTPDELANQRYNGTETKREETTAEVGTDEAQPQDIAETVEEETESVAEIPPSLREDMINDDKSINMRDDSGRVAIIWKGSKDGWRIRYYETDGSMRNPKGIMAKRTAVDRLEADGYKLIPSNQSMRFQTAAEDESYIEAKRSDDQRAALNALRNVAEENGYLSRTFVLKDDGRLPSEQYPVVNIGEVRYQTDHNAEMEAIMDEAVKNGTYMKAPNGASSNLTPRQWLQVRTEAFKKWFGDWINDPENASKVVDDNGEPLVVYHGRVSEFNIFDKSKLNIESNMGAGFYFSNDYEDVERNYASEEGADLQNKIARVADELESKAQSRMDMEEFFALPDDYFTEQAKTQFISSEPNIVSVFVRIQNPVYVGGENELFLDYSEEYDEETEEYGESEGILVDFAEAFEEISKNYDYRGEGESIWNYVIDATNDGGITFSELKRILDDNIVDYLEDEHGDIAIDEVIRQALEQIGYDGIIDSTVSEKFNMELSDDTVHYIAFDSNNIKSATDNNGDFSLDNDDIRYQSAVIDSEYMAAIKAGDIDKAQTMVMEAAKNAGFYDAYPEQASSYNIRTKAAPKKTIKLYKLFYVDEDGDPVVLFVGGADKLPRNIWLDHTVPYHFTGPNGKEYVPTLKTTEEGNQTGSPIPITPEVREELIKRGYLPKGSKAKTYKAVALRTAWHAVDNPFFPQGGKKVPAYGELDGMFYTMKHKMTQVIAEVEFSYDYDYTERAHAQAKAWSKDGEFIPGNADFEFIPDDEGSGAYEYATNQFLTQFKGKAHWWLGDSMKINRILTEEECNAILDEHGLPHQEWIDGHLDLDAINAELFHDDGYKKTLAPVTYDDSGNIIPLSQRFDSSKNDVRYQTAMPVNPLKLDTRRNIKLTEEERTERRKAMNEWREEMKAWTESTGQEPLSFASGNNVYYVSEDPSKGNEGKWRVTHFMGELPVGHEVFDTKYEAVMSHAVEYEPESVNKVLFQSIGIKGATRLGELVLSLQQDAIEYEKENFPARQIRKWTGWERGIDGRWRMDIPDYYKQVNVDKIYDKSAKRLWDIYDNPELYKAYPELADIAIHYDSLENWRIQAHVAEDGITLNNAIIDTKYREPRELAKTLIHEIQHLIQDIEGFAEGGNPNSIKDYIMRSEKLLNKRNYELIEAEQKAYKLSIALYKLRNAYKAGEDGNDIKNKLDEAFLDISEEYRKRIFPDNFWTEDLHALTAAELNEYANKVEELEEIIKKEITDHNEHLEGDAAIYHALSQLYAYDLYHRLAGEIEARAAEAKIDNDYTYILTESVEDVKRIDALIFHNGEKLASPDITRGNEVRFQSADGDTVVQEAYGNLIITHTLDAERITDLHELGGIPMPSLAITKSVLQKALNHFGDITLLGDKTFAERLMRKGEVYDRDMWSPTTPKPEFKFDEKKLQKKINEITKDIKLDDRVLDDSNHLYSRSDYRTLDDLTYFLSKSPHVYAAWAKANNVDFEVPIIEHNYDYSADTYQKALDWLLENTNDGYNISVEEAQAFLDYMTPFLIAEKDKKYADMYKKYPNMKDAMDKTVTDFAYGKVLELVKDAYDFTPTASEVDTLKMRDEIYSHVDEVREWLKPQFEPLYSAPRIKIGRSYYPYTAENIVKYMSRLDRTGAVGIMITPESVGANAARQITSIDKAHEKENALNLYDKDEYEKVSEEVNDRFINAMYRAWQGSTESMAYLDTGLEVMAKYFKKYDTDSVANLKKAFSKESEWMKMSDSDYEDVLAFAEFYRNKIHPYYEAKPEEVMQFSDFTAAFVPAGMDEEARAILENAGLDIVEYEDENRQQVLNDYVQKNNEVRFQTSLTPEEQTLKEEAEANGTYMLAPNGEPSKLTASQWLSVRTAAFKAWFGDWEHDPENASKILDENGEPMVMYHGSPNKWEVFNNKDRGLRSFNYGEEGIVYATDNETVADDFFSWEHLPSVTGSDLFYRRGKKGYVYSLFMNMRNPLNLMALTDEDIEKINPMFEKIYRDHEQPEEFSVEMGKKAIKQFQYARELFEKGWDAQVIKHSLGLILQKSRELPNAGYDGFICEMGDIDYLGANEYAVFDPTNIKSATDNSGAYDGRNANILFQTLDLDTTLDALAAVAKDFTDYMRMVESYFYDQAELGVVKDAYRKAWQEEKGVDVPKEYRRITDDEVTDENRAQYERENPSGFYIENPEIVLREDLPEMTDEEIKALSEIPENTPEEWMENVDLLEESIGDDDDLLEQVIYDYSKMTTSDGVAYTLTNPNISLTTEDQKDAQFERMMRDQSGIDFLLDALKIIARYGTKDFVSAEAHEEWYYPDNIEVEVKEGETREEALTRAHEAIVPIREKMVNGVYGDTLKNAAFHFTGQKRNEELDPKYVQMLVSNLLNHPDLGRRLVYDITGVDYWKAQSEFGSGIEERVENWDTLSWHDKRIEGAKYSSEKVREALASGSEKVKDGLVESTLKGLEDVITEQKKIIEENNAAYAKLKEKNEETKQDLSKVQHDRSDATRAANKSFTIDNELYELSQELHRKASKELKIENPLPALRSIDEEFKEWNRKSLEEAGGKERKGVEYLKHQYVMDHLSERIDHVQRQRMEIDRFVKNERVGKQAHKDSVHTAQMLYNQREREKASQERRDYVEWWEDTLTGDERREDLKKKRAEEAHKESVHRAQMVYNQRERDKAAEERRDYARWWKEELKAEDRKTSLKDKLDWLAYLHEVSRENLSSAKEEKLKRHVAKEKERSAHNLKKKEMVDAFNLYDAVTLERWKAQKRYNAQQERYEEKLDFQRQQSRIDAKHAKEEAKQGLYDAVTIERIKRAKAEAALRKSSAEAIQKLKEAYKEKAELKKAKAYKKKLVDKLMKAPSQNVHQDYAKMIVEIQSAINPSFYDKVRLNFGTKESPNLQTFLIKDLSELIKKFPDLPIFSTMNERQLAKLSQMNLNDLTITELEDLVAMVDELRRLGLQKRQEIIDQQKATVNFARKKMIDQLVNLRVLGEKEATLPGSKESRQRKGFVGKFFEAERSILYPTYNMNRLAQKLDGGKDGGIFKYILIDEKRRHQRDTLTDVDGTMTKLLAKFDELGVKPEAFAENVAVDLGGITQTYQKDDMYYFWYSQFNSESRDAVAYGLLVGVPEKREIAERAQSIPENERKGWQADRVREIGDKRYEALIEAARTMMNAPENESLNKAAEELIALWQDKGEFTKVKDVMGRVYNVDVQEVQFYIPIKREGAVGEDIGARTKQEMLNLTPGQKPSVKKGFTKERHVIPPQNQTAVKTGLLKLFEASVFEQAHVANNLEYVALLNGIFKSRNVDSRYLEQLIRDKFGDSMWDAIDDHIREIADPKAFKKADAADKAVNFLRGSLYTSYLGFKLSGFVLQAITSPAPFLAKVNPVRLISTYLKMMMVPKTMWNEIMEKSVVMKNRSFDMVAGILKDAVKDLDLSKFQRGYYKTLEAGVMTLELADRWAVGGGWWALYEQNLAQGMSEEMAIKLADDFVQDTQPLSDKTEMARLFKNKNAAMTILLQFQTSLNVIWNNITYDMPHAFMNGRWQEGIGIIVGYGLAGMMLTAVKDGFDDDDDDKDKMKKLAYGFTTQFVSGIPLVSDVVDGLLEHAITGEYRPMFGRSNYPAVDKWTKAIHTVISKNPGWEEKAIKELREALLLSSGLPYSGYNELKAIKDVGLGALLGRRK